MHVSFKYIPMPLVLMKSIYEGFLKNIFHSTWKKYVMKKKKLILVVSSCMSKFISLFTDIFNSENKNFSK